jgi:hypothetical protein
VFFATGLLSIAAQPSAPTAVDDVIATYAKTHALDLRLVNGRLEGPAADWLRSEAATSRFVFLGESHDAREIPLIAGALWRDLVPLGYTHVAIEAGPWLGDRLDRFARFGDRQALAQFQAATWPRLPNNSVPPNSQEDVAFYEQLGGVRGPHSASESPLIWGLDYEYRATPLLKRLAELSLGSPYRSQIESVRARVEAAEKRGDYKTSAFDAEIGELNRLMPATPGTELFQILDGLRWRLFAASERDEEIVKKQLFLRNYQAAKRTGEVAPRVMLRFGGFHGARGLMPNFGDSTLANMIAEFAAIEGTRMLNISFPNCQAAPASDFPARCSWEQEQVLKPFRAAATGAWTLFDLRGLREPLRQAQFAAPGREPATKPDAEKRLVLNALWSQVMRVDAIVLIQNSQRSQLPTQ